MEKFHRQREVYESEAEGLWAKRIYLRFISIYMIFEAMKPGKIIGE